MKHEKVMRKLPLYYLRELDPNEIIKIEEHLKKCSACREELLSLERLFKEMEEHEVPVFNSLAFERVKRLVAEKMQRRDIEAKEKIKMRLIVLVSLFSFSVGILLPVLIFNIFSPVVSWEVFENFPRFVALWWGVFCLLSLLTGAIVFKIKQTFLREVRNGT